MTESTRGILSDADRDFLEKSKEKRREDYSFPAITQRKNTIAQRTYYGLRDLAFLYHNLPESQRREAFERLEGGHFVDKRTHILQHGAAFLFLGVAELANVDLDDEEYYETLFDLVIEKVLMKHGAGAGIPKSIDLDVEIEGWSHADEGLSAIDPTEHSEDTLRFLLVRGEISNEEFARGILEQKSED